MCLSWIKYYDYDTWRTFLPHHIPNVATHIVCQCVYCWKEVRSLVCRSRGCDIIIPFSIFPISFGVSQRLFFLSQLDFFFKFSCPGTHCPSGFWLLCILLSVICTVSGGPDMDWGRDLPLWHCPTLLSVEIWSDPVGARRLWDEALRSWAPPCTTLVQASWNENDQTYLRTAGYLAQSFDEIQSPPSWSAGPLQGESTKKHRDKVSLSTPRSHA